jgi:hypothetical protein
VELPPILEFSHPYRMFHFGDSPKRLISNCKLD